MPAGRQGQASRQAGVEAGRQAGTRAGRPAGRQAGGRKGGREGGRKAGGGLFAWLPALVNLINEACLEGNTLMHLYSVVFQCP